MTPTDPNARLKRREAAEALRSAGYPISAATLATKACRGGGPIYRLFGKTVIYLWGDLLDWAEQQMSPPRRSTSEHDTGSPRFGAS